MILHFDTKYFTLKLGKLTLVNLNNNATLIYFELYFYSNSDKTIFLI